MNFLNVATNALKKVCHKFPEVESLVRHSKTIGKFELRLVKRHPPNQIRVIQAITGAYLLVHDLSGIFDFGNGTLAFQYARPV